MTTTIQTIRDALERPYAPADASEEHRDAAVALILTPELDVLFMRRAEREGDPWSGHLSFPGGHVDPDDATLLAAAMRETQEEIGLFLHNRELLGRLDTLATLPGLPKLHIHPFVFATSEPLQLSLNHEVASVHRLSLAAFLRDEGRSDFAFHWKGADVRLPCVNFDGVRLWGLTLRILDDLASRIKTT